MFVYYIRHAQSTNNSILGLADEEYDQQRVADPTLSEKGILQTKVLAQSLYDKQLQISEIRCSPQRRAIDTAQIISQKLQIPIKIVQDIHEFGGSHKNGLGIPGATRKELQELYPNVEIDERIQDNGWFFKELRETKDEGIERSKQILDNLSKEPPKTIIMIGHGNLLNSIVGILTDRALDSKHYFFHQNTGITILQQDKDNKLQLNCFNDYSHLQQYKALTGVDLMDGLVDANRM